MKKSFLFSFLLLLGGIMYAHDFTATINGHKIYFNITSNFNKTAEVTYNGSITNNQCSYYEGDLDIPAKVRYNNEVYSIVGVGAKAFSGADKLTGVAFPSAIEYIDDFAFEGCTSLSRIIFPGQAVTFGEGVFFKCDKIQDISFGSDWKELNLQMFRWSDSLKVINIPAKVEKIKNLKSLMSLEQVVVDLNNSRFSSEDGVLYNKNKDVLYGCPRSYKSTLAVYPSTKTITKGALIDCNNLEIVVLPDSLQSLSYKEFSRIQNLKEIVFKSDSPINTAVINNKEVFALTVYNQNVQLVVSKKSLKTYRSALVQEGGEYAEIGDKIPYIVRTDEMLQNKNIVGVKNFKMYDF